MWSNIAILTCPNCGCASVGVAKDGQCLCENCGTTFNIIETQTNEEWFCSLSTEEKAKWLDKVAENCCQICDEENRELCRGNIAIGCKFENAKKWELWLKQPHLTSK